MGKFVREVYLHPELNNPAIMQLQFAASGMGNACDRKHYLVSKYAANLVKLLTRKSGKCILYLTSA
ncbi:MAG: hypothetical protein ACHBN1_25985 [Heteroscytonema crispum UTEX LB 1556]